MPQSGGAGVGAAVARLRAAKGLTQQAVADAVGISQPHLANIESGRDGPSVATLRALARALGVTVDSLLQEGPPDAPGRPPAHNAATAGHGEMTEGARGPQEPR